MKKKIILFIILFFMTGCTANYNIEIYNNKIIENMNFVDTNPSTWYEEAQYGISFYDLVEASSKYPYPAFRSTIVDENDTIKIDGVEYYDNEFTFGNGKLGMGLKYDKFKIKDFSDSSIVSKCYQYFNIMERDGEIIFSTSTTNKCFDEYQKLENITVKLKTNHKVVSSNASDVKGYNYTWNLTKENKDDSAILITIKKNEYIFNYENEFINKVIYIGVIIGIILGIGGIVYIYFSNKTKKMNQI